MYNTTVMPIQEGQTRDCTQPWQFVQIKVDGSFCPCCDHPALGNVNKRPLSELLECDEIRGLRKSLIEGNLDKWCKNCQASPTIGIDEFRGKLIRLLKS